MARSSSATYARLGTQRPRVCTGEFAWLNRVLYNRVTYDASCISSIDIGSIREVNVVAAQELLISVALVKNDRIVDMTASLLQSNVVRLYVYAQLLVELLGIGHESEKWTKARQLLYHCIRWFIKRTIVRQGRNWWRWTTH